MTRWLAQNLGTFVLALILAIMVWVVALQSSDPIISRQLTRPVPLRLANQPPGTIVLNNQTGAVRLTLRGPRSTLDNVTAEQVDAYVNLRDLPPGEHTVCVTPVISVTGVIVDPDTPPTPACVDIDLERLDERQMPIHVTIDGSPARGYQFAPAPIMTTTTAAVDGPTSYLGRVAGVYGTIEAADARATISEVVTLNPLDMAGQVVTGVTVRPPHVAVTVEVAKLEDFREVPVTVDWKGQPAPGYSVTGINVDPPTVLVTGSPDVIRNLPGFVQTMPVDITNASASVIRRVTLVMPAGVSLVGEQSVLVEVVIQPIQVSSTITRTVELQGLASTLTATVSPPTVDVILTGPAAVLNSLSPGDVRVIVDVFQFGPGTYTLTPRAIILPQDVQAQTVLPNALQVTIVIMPTPTPTPSPTPTATPKPRPG